MPGQTSNGALIIFDGIDGGGKTTQIQLVQEQLEKAGHKVMSLRNPGGTPIGEALRQVFLSPVERPPTTDLYMSVAIQESLIEEVSDLRRRGYIVLMDRGPFSIAAYQVYGSGIDPGLGWKHVGMGMNKLSPEATILYVANVKLVLSRAKNKPNAGDYFESKPIDYFNRVAEGYKQAAKRYDNVEVINASDSLETVNKATMAVINQVLTKLS
jgi:dTMP kinase